MFIYILYICYIYKCVFMCVYMYIYECMYVYVYIYIYIFFQVVVSTPRISQPVMPSIIFRHFRYKKKCLVFTTFNLHYCTPVPKNAGSHENKISNL